MFRINRLVKAATLAAASVGSAGAAAPLQLTTFDAVYDASWGSMHLGELHFSLRRESEFCYVYRSSAKPVFMARLIYGSPTEESRFCIVDGKVRPIYFAYDHGKESFTLDFDWIKGEVRGAGQVRELPADAQDRFGMHQAVRLWALQQEQNPPEGEYTLTMVEDDRMREYTLRVNGEHRVEVPAGQYDTFLLERVDDRKIGRFYVAPSASTLPVKVVTGKDGKIQLSMDLKSLTLHDQEVAAED